MLDLAYAESRRVVILTLRYPVEFALALALMGALFYGIVLGSRILGAEATPGAMKALATGYVVWMLAVGPIVGIAGDIQGEAAGGTLENLFLSRHSLLALLLTRAAVSFGHSCIFVTVMASAIAVLGGIHMHAPPELVLYGVVLLVGATGIGLVLGGAALVLKRVQFLIIAVYALLFPLAFIAAPADAGANAILPLAQIAGGLREALSTGSSMPAAALAGAATNACVWLAFGLAAFAALKRRAERLGTISER